MKKIIKVLIADDSLTMRKQIAEIINNEPDMIVAAEASNGREAVAAAGKIKPDIIIMDVVMPVMDGPAAVEQIMKQYPMPIIICSSVSNRGEDYRTWDALKAGALDKIEKTDAVRDPAAWEKNFLRTIRAGARVKIRGKKQSVRARTADNRPFIKQQNFNVAAFGLSTGGPGIVAEILKNLPRDFQHPVLLCIHTGDSQTSTFPEWLDNQCSLKVLSAVDGMNINKYSGSVLTAPPGTHMTVQNRRIKLVNTCPVNFSKPSVDVLFDSLASEKSLNAVAVLLTGIGKDGAKGLKAVYDSGGYTICQDKETSIVFGMPMAAIELGAAVEVLPHYSIAGRIVSLFS